MALFAWSLATASVAAIAYPADAAARAISIPSAGLSEAIRQLSSQTGVSVGSAGTLPNIRTRQVRGASSPTEALRQMLAGTGLRAIATGPSSFRIEQVPVVAPPSPTIPLSRPEAEIVVTGTKRPERLATLPATAHVVREPDVKSASSLPGTYQLSRQIPSLTVSSLGAGLNRLFLRGIGDGPLNGFNQGSVAVLLDDTRLNYDAPDPDWTLIDVKQVEVLEGPQGPLYGTGAIGGIIKISTNRPDLDETSGRVAASLSVTQDSDVSNSQSLIANVALIPDRLAVRAVGYRGFQDGWIDNVGGPSDSNREELIGGRMALRWTPSTDWTVDLAGAIQNRRAGDSQYVDGNLGALVRPNRLREPRDLDARTGTLTVVGPIGALEVTSVTGLSRQEAVATYDATPLSGTLGTFGQTGIRDDRNYRLFDEEARIRNTSSSGLKWLAGLSLVNASTDAQIVTKDSEGSKPLLNLNRSVTEGALFGDVSARLSRDLTFGGGARIFLLNTDDEGREGQSIRKHGRSIVRGAGDANITWTRDEKVTVFLRAATGYRPGGINAEPDATQAAYEADELGSVELGSRLTIDPALAIDVTSYAARWQHVQADELLPNGLVATRNAGNALNVGMESDLRWSIQPTLSLRAGFMFQSAKLESSAQAAGIDDRRLPAVPQFAGRVEMKHQFRWGSWRGEGSLGVRWTGATHMSFNASLDRRTASHASADASLTLSRKDWSISFVGENLTNNSADTFAFGNPYRVRASPQRTPLKPRIFGLNLIRDF